MAIVDRRHRHIHQRGPRQHLPEQHGAEPSDIGGAEIARFDGDLDRGVNHDVYDRAEQNNLYYHLRQLDQITQREHALEAERRIDAFHLGRDGLDGK